MNIFSSMRHSIMRYVSKNNARKTLFFVATAIVACGLLIGCPEPANTGGGDSGTPNLAITATVMPESVTTGGTATVTVTVTNNGTAASTATMATLHRSATTTISATDETKIGDAVAIPSIPAKGDIEKTFTIPASETGTVGMLHYGACIAGSNPAKCSDAITLTVTAAPAPNLTITAEIAPTSVATGGTATVTVTVTNSGTGASTATMATLYRSTDETINTGDTAVGTPQMIPSIPATENRTATFTIPASETGTAGMLHYGACIPAATSGGTATCSSAITLMVTDTASPDLNVQDAPPTLNENSYVTGTSATISIIVTNSGSASSTGGTVTFYRQTGVAPAPATDTAVGMPHTLSAITAGGMETATATFNAGAVGMAMYYAVISGESADTNTSNDTSAPTAPVAIVPQIPDLTITNLASLQTTIAPGGTFMAGVVVRNAGGASSAATSVSFALVDNAGMVVKDLTGATEIPALDAGASTSTSPPLLSAITVPSDTAPGTYRLRATVGTVTGETNTDNNTLILGGDTPVDITISTTQAPDLDVRSGIAPTLAPDAASYVTGTSVTISVDVYNRGNAESSGGTVTFYRQTGESPDITADTTVGAPHTLSTIAANGMEEATATFNAGAVGMAQYYAVLSGVTGDTNTSNNTSEPTAPVTIVAAIPDLDVSGVPVILGASSYTMGDATATIRVVVSNIGTVASTMGARVRFFRQTGENPAPDTDTEVAMASVPAIMAGMSETVSTTFTVGSAGTNVLYYAFVDRVANETDGNNNTSMPSNAITINAPPDLTITALIVTPNPVIAGNMVEATVTVMNAGTGQSAATTASLELYNFGGSHIPLAGTITVDALDAGESDDFDGMITIPRHIGDVHTALNVRARVASVSGETNTGNNAFALGGDTPMELNITARIVDLTPGKPTITPATTFTEGQMATLSAVITNNGNVDTYDSSGRVFFYRLGGTMPNLTTDNRVGESSYVLNTITVGGTTTATITFALTDADVGTDVQYYAYMTTVGGLGETNTDNNTSALSDGVTIAARNPDLEITSFTIENSVTSVAQGGTFTANVVVRNNNGTTASTASTVSFALVDSAGMNPVSLTGTIMVPNIAASMSTPTLTGMITVPIATATGMYHLRATVSGSNHTFLLGGTPSSTNFTVTAVTTTTFNLAGDCLILIGDVNCNVVRTDDLTMGEEIGTVSSSDATAFALANTVSNPMFVIDPTSGIVTANRGVAIGDIPATFAITVTGGVGAGIQRVRIINTAGAKVDETNNIGLMAAPISTAGITLFEPGVTARTHACIGESSGCVTSYQTGNSRGGYGNELGWYLPYNSGTTAVGLDASAYGRVYVEYNLNSNTLSPPPPARFTVRLGYAYFILDTSDGVVADSTWRTASFALVQGYADGGGYFMPSSISNIGFYDQNRFVDLSVRAVYLR